MTILQHPSSPVNFDYSRDLIPETPEGHAAKAETEAEREGLFALSQPGIDVPIHLLALRGELPAATCAACGEPNALHFDTSGFHFLGCAGVPSRKALARLTQRPLRDTAVWGDAHPTVSAAIRDVLLAGCGLEVSQFYDGLRVDERINLSRRLAEIAAIALRAEDAQR